MKVHKKAIKVSRKRSNTKTVDKECKFAHNVDMLKRYRDKLGLSQAEIAEAIGVSVRTIKYIESGQYGKSKLVKEAVQEWVKCAERMERESIQKGDSA